MAEKEQLDLNEYFSKFEKSYREDYPALSPNAEKLLNERYYMQTLDESGNLVNKEKTFDELCQRVARCLASAETLYTDSIDRVKLIEINIFNDIRMKRFLFNSPAIFNLGRGLCNDINNQEMHDIVYKPIAEMSYDDYKKIYNNKNIRQMCFACFVVGIDDNLDSIMGAMTDAAKISKAGGGVGFSFDNTRERGSSVHGGMGGKASGPVSWIQMFNGMANAVVQGGQRRAALMGILKDDHPDIYEFIHAKDEDGVLDKFNLSVAVSDSLIENVINKKDDTPFIFHSRKSGNDLTKVFVGRNDKNEPIYKENITCGELWNEICSHAWKRGDPGVFFIDRTNNDNVLRKDPGFAINGTNPCGEQGLPNNTCCNLGSININAFITTKDDSNTTINLYDFINQVYRSIYYLDLILDASEFPIDKIKERSLKIRPVGLGLMGIADMAYRCNWGYNSPDFLQLCNTLAAALSVAALDATTKIVTVIKKDPFNEHDLVRRLFEEDASITPEDITSDNLDEIFNKMKEAKLPYTLVNTIACMPIMKNLYFSGDEETYKAWSLNLLQNVVAGNMRNSRRLTIAPTGSTSMIFDASGGIEPLFSLSWGRKVFDASSTEKRTTTYDYVYAYLTSEEKEKLDNGEKLEGDKYLCANDLSVEDHIKIVSIFAKLIDASISKTVNLVNSATVDDVKNTFVMAYKYGCKGITIYRDGSRSMQPVTKKETTIAPKKKAKRPHFAKGLTENVKTSSLGNLYVTVNFNEEDDPFEVWIRIGKSGSELTSMVDALARTVSIALRSGTDMKDIVKTLADMNSSPAWIYDSVDGREVVMTSIPDAVAKLITEIIMEHDKQKNTDSKDKDVEPILKDYNEYSKGQYTCPNCGSTAYQTVSGCKICLRCGYSKCGV